MVAAACIRPTGNPRSWTPEQWRDYNAWEAAQPEPPRLGPYENAQQWFSSDEWLQIVRDSLVSHKLCYRIAKQGNDAEAMKFYETQIKACERDLGIMPEPPPQLPLFFWEAA